MSEPSLPIVHGLAVKTSISKRFSKCKPKPPPRPRGKTKSKSKGNGKGKGKAKAKAKSKSHRGRAKGRRARRCSDTESATDCSSDEGSTASSATSSSGTDASDDEFEGLSLDTLRLKAGTVRARAPPGIYSDSDGGQPSAPLERPAGPSGPGGAKRPGSPNAPAPAAKRTKPESERASDLRPDAFRTTGAASIPATPRPVYPRPTCNPAPRTVMSLSAQLYEVSLLRDSVRLDAPNEWMATMFEHVFTILGSAMISIGAVHGDVQRLTDTVSQRSAWTATSCSGSDSPPNAAPPLTPRIVAPTVDDYNRLTGRSVSANVLWREVEAREAFMQEHGLVEWKAGTTVPFSFCVRDESGRCVPAARVTSIRALIREVVAGLEALPDKRRMGPHGRVGSRCRRYYLDHHRYELYQAIREIEGSAPELALCDAHYKALNGIDRRLKTIAAKVVTTNRGASIKDEDDASDEDDIPLSRPHHGKPQRGGCHVGTPAPPRVPQDAFQSRGGCRITLVGHPSGSRLHTAAASTKPTASSSAVSRKILNEAPAGANPRKSDAARDAGSARPARVDTPIPSAAIALGGPSVPPAAADGRVHAVPGARARTTQLPPIATLFPGSPLPTQYQHMMLPPGIFGPPPSAP